MTSLQVQIPTKTRQTRLAWTQIYKLAKSNVCHVESWTRNISSPNSTVTIDPIWGARKRACQNGVRMEKVNRLHRSNSATEGTLRALIYYITGEWMIKEMYGVTKHSLFLRDAQIQVTQKFRTYIF